MLLVKVVVQDGVRGPGHQVVLVLPTRSRCEAAMTLTSSLPALCKLRTTHGMSHPLLTLRHNSIRNKRSLHMAEEKREVIDKLLYRSRWHPFSNHINQ